MIQLRRHRRVVLGVYLVVLLVLTMAPLPARPEGPAALDKIVHAALFAGLAVLLYWNLGVGSRARALSALLAATAAGLIEILQRPVPYRSDELWDFIAGAAGALLGAAIAHLAGRARDDGA